MQHTHTCPNAHTTALGQVLHSGMFKIFPAKAQLLFLVLLYAVVSILSGIFCFLFQKA